MLTVVECQFRVMYCLILFLAISCCRPSDSVTSTRIFYLPNGQVAGYELIINNTVRPIIINAPLPRDLVSKIVKHTSNVGSTFTRVNEQVIGENSYLNVHSILEQNRNQPLQRARMKYPPRARYVNDVPENDKHAALTVPVNRSESSANSGVSMRPKIRVNEQVIGKNSLGLNLQKGKNSYLNVHRILNQHRQQPQQEAEMEYPLTMVLMVPGVRYVNGVPENITLRFAKIGPYAALIVPTNRSDSSAISELPVPPKIRDIITSYIEVQDPLAQSSQPTKTGYGYDPPTYNNPWSASPFTTASVNEQQPKKPGIYNYPEAASISSPSHEPSEIGNAKSNGFVIRVVNSARGDPNSQASGNKYQEFFIPARPDQLVPERNNKIIANPFKYSGPSDPSTSQFEEVYSEDNPSFSSSTASDPPNNQLPELAADFKDPSADTEQRTSNLGSNSATSVYTAGQTHDDKFSQLRNDQSTSADVNSAQTFGKFQEHNIGSLSNVNSAAASSVSGLGSDQPQQAVGQISNEGSDTADSDQKFGKSQSTTRSSLEELLNEGPYSADQLQATTVKSDVSFAVTAGSAQKFGAILGGTAQSNRNDAYVASSSVRPFDQIHDTRASVSKLGQIEGSAIGSNIQFGRFQGNTVGQNLGLSTNYGSSSASSGSDQQFKQFQSTSVPNVEQISSDSSATADAHSTSQFNQFQDNAGQNLAHISQGKSPPVTPYSLQPLEQFRNQKEGQTLNVGQKNIALTTADVSGNNPLFNSEMLEVFISNPSLTTPLKILLPSGQTTAALTPTGNLAKVELPSSASLRGQLNGNVVIPKTVIPLSSRGGTPIEYQDRGTLLNSEYYQTETAIPFAKHNNFEGLQNVQNGVARSPLNLINQQQGNILGSTAGGFKTVSNFDPTSAAAAAVAAVAADNDHFKQFDTAEKVETFQDISENGMYGTPPPIVGPHTEGLLKALNKIVTVPMRQPTVLTAA